MNEFGMRLKQLRSQLDVNQNEIAKQLGTTITGYSSYERGNSMPCIQRIVRLAELFQTSVQYLVTGKELSDDYQEGNNTPFSERLAACREQKKLTQKQVAEYLGIRKVTYQGYEYARFEPKIDKLLKLAELFHVTLDELVGRNKK